MRRAGEINVRYDLATTYFSVCSEYGRVDDAVGCKALTSTPNKKTTKIGEGRAGPGRPKGARGKVSKAARSVLGEEGGLVVQKVIDAALAGDTAAGRALLPFLVPRAERAIQIDLARIMHGRLAGVA